MGCDNLDLSVFKKLGQYKAHFATTPKQFNTHAKNADIIITNKVYVGRKQMAAVPNLKLIAIPATGYNNVDLEAAKDHGVAAANVPSYATIPTSEHALSFLLAFSHRLVENHNASVSGEWQKSEQACYTAYPFQNLAGKTLGVVGYGTIGKRVAKVAKALDMNVLVAKLPGRSAKGAVKRVPLKTLLKKVDYLTLHCPLTEQTHHLIDKAALSLMPKTAVIVNTARGAVVDEVAVAKALKAGKLRGYAADAFSEEPLSLKHPLFDKKIRDRVLFSPHIAWASFEAREILVAEVAKNIQAFLKGKKRNRIL